MAFLDEIEEGAQEIGSVNTIVNVAGRLIGSSTDGPGFMRSLAEAGFDPKGRNALVLGAGGAGRAVTFALAGAGDAPLCFLETASTVLGFSALLPQMVSILHPIPTETTAGRLTNDGAKLLVAMSIGLTVFLVAIERWPKLLGWLLAQLAKRLPGKAGDRAVKMLQHFLEGLSLFRDVPRLLWVFLLSFAMFLVFALGLSVSMWALRIEVPWYGGLIMLVITAIGIMVPAAPGYIGTLNLACWAGLALFSVGKDLAAPFSWFYWAGQWIPVTVVGLWYLRREGLTLGAITKVQESGP